MDIQFEDSFQPVNGKKVLLKKKSGISPDIRHYYYKEKIIMTEQDIFSIGTSRTHVKRTRHYRQMPDGYITTCDDEYMLREQIKKENVNGTSHLINKKGISVEEVNWVDGVKQGLYILRDPEGQMIEYGRYENDRVEGEVVQWNEKGQKTAILQIKNNLKHGKQRFFENKNEIVEHYVDNVKISHVGAIVNNIKEICGIDQKPKTNGVHYKK